MSSIILWGGNNDSWAFERPQKIHGIQPRYVYEVISVVDGFILVFIQRYAGIKHLSLS